MKRTIAVLATLALVTGCSDNAAQQADTPPTTQATVIPSPTPTPTTPTPRPTPMVLTRAQAAQRYLAIIKPVNDALDAPKCKAVDGFYGGGDSWPPNDHPEWDPTPWKVAAACAKGYIPVMVASQRALQSTPWPIDARQDVADLISQGQALLYCVRKIARAKSESEMYDAYACVQPDDGSADRVRARFGLPGRSD